MIKIINLFLGSGYYDKINSFFAKKIFKLFKVFFVHTDLKNLPASNYKINKNDIIKELNNGKEIQKNNLKPYITYSHLLDLVTALNKKPLNFFDYGAGNLNLFFYLRKKIDEINYFYHDQKDSIHLVDEFIKKENLKNITIGKNIEKLNIDLVYFGSTLQYLKNYQNEIIKFKNNSKYILISQTPFFEDENLMNEHIILKQVNMHPNINFLYALNYNFFINFMKKNNFILIDKNFNKVTKFMNFKNFENRFKNLDMYDLFFKKYE